MNRHLKRLLGSFVFLLVPIASIASEYDIPKVVALQKRAYTLSDEVTAQASYLPLDSFTTYFSTGAAYTHYFSEYLGWEILNAAYANSYSSGLLAYLITKYGVQTQQFDLINYYGTTNLVYTPMYMKNLLFNSGIVYGEISLVAGLGITKFATNGNTNTVDFGAIFRYYLGKSTSIKFDFREYIFLTGNVKNNLAFTGGFAYNFGDAVERSKGPDAEE